MKFEWLWLCFLKAVPELVKIQMALFFLEEVQIGSPPPHDLPHFPLSPPLPMFSKKEPENGFVTIFQ